VERGPPQVGVDGEDPRAVLGSETARLATVVVFPSPGLELLTTTTRPRFAVVEKMRFVRTTR
jgi:hypothetical protein